MAFALAEPLARDSVPVLPRLIVSQLRLMDDARYPWLLLVPERPGLVELHDLEEHDAQALMREVRACTRALADLFPLDKTNVGALGNMVPQLHVHVIGRRRDDPAWPGPVWGVGAAEPYRPEERDTRIRRLIETLRAR